MILKYPWPSFCYTFCLCFFFIHSSPPGTSFIDFACALLIHVHAYASTKSVTFTPPYKKYCCTHLKYKKSPFMKYIILVSKCFSVLAFDYLDRHLGAQNVLFFVCSAQH